MGQTRSARGRFQYGLNGQRYYRETSWWDQDQQQLLTEKVFIVGNYEDQYLANDPDYQRIQKTRIDSNVLHILATSALGDEPHYRYLHRDHLGSIEKVTDGNGNLLIDSKGARAYDPYGARRKADWSGELSEQELEELLSSVGLSTQRGFTDHEHLDRTGLIHMNGRIYDPTLGRFLSPDPFVQAPTFSQSWNRYSYVSNNPLSFADPSGYIYCEGKVDGNCGGFDDWFTDFFSSIARGYTSTYHEHDAYTEPAGGTCFYLDPYCTNPGPTPQERRAALQAEEQAKADTAKAQGRAEAGGAMVAGESSGRSCSGRPCIFRGNNPGADLPSLPQGIVDGATALGDGAFFAITLPARLLPVEVASLDDIRQFFGGSGANTESLVYQVTFVAGGIVGGVRYMVELALNTSQGRPYEMHA